MKQNEEDDTGGKDELNGIGEARKWQNIMLVNQCIVRWSRRAGQFAQEGLVLLAHTPASLFFDQHTLIDQHTHNFFNKEWVAFSPALNSVVQHIGKLVRFEQSSNQFTTFLTCKCI